MERDCEVCTRLMKEKHKSDLAWKVVAIIALIVAVVFICLYFGSGAMVTETIIEIDADKIGSNNEMGDNGSIIVGTDNGTINGTMETTDSLPLMVFCGIVVGAIIIAGGNIIASHNKKDS